jgi:hypothetical protein
MIIDLIGAPDPAEPVSLQFENRLADLKWDSYTHDMLAGWFKDGFINLLGIGLDALKPCVDAWSWMVPPSDDRTIIGRNAYGAIAFGDGMNSMESKISIVDPVNLKLHGPIDFVGFFGRFIVMRDVPSFIDDSVYRAWRGKGGKRLPLHEMLGIKAALPLDGKMELGNFEREHRRLLPGDRRGLCEVAEENEEAHARPPMIRGADA